MALCALTGAYPRDLLHIHPQNEARQTIIPKLDRPIPPEVSMFNATPRLISNGPYGD